MGISGDRTAHELAYILQLAGNKVVICDCDFLENMEHSGEEVGMSGHDFLKNMDCWGDKAGMMDCDFLKNVDHRGDSVAPVTVTVIS